MRYVAPRKRLYCQSRHRECRDYARRGAIVGALTGLVSTQETSPDGAARPPAGHRKNSGARRVVVPDTRAQT